YTAAQMNPPDNIAFDSIGRIALELNIRGRDLAPENGIAPAASAYLHLKIRPPAGVTRRPTDEVAFLAGAASRGMDRVGIVGTNTGPDCEGAVAIVRWGPESTACLNAAQITLIGFTDVQDGDVIVPAWETALSRIGDDVVLRFPQPERPDLNMMNVDMMFAANPARPGRGYSIGEFDAGVGAIDMASGAGEMDTNFVDENLAMNTIGDFGGEMVV